MDWDLDLNVPLYTRDYLQEEQDRLKADKWNEFENELKRLLNYHSIDNDLDMHDFVVASVITEVVKSMIFAKAEEKRLKR